MQSTSKKDNANLQIIVTGLILIQIVLFVLAENQFVILLSSFFLLGMFFLFFHFWVNFFLPESGFNKNFNLLVHLFLDALNVEKSLLVLKGGKIQQDYFLLKKKPAFRYLFIRERSAAITLLGDNQLRLRSPGFNYLGRGEEIILSFDLRLHKFTYGPKFNENPFDLIQSGESFTDFHAKQLRSQKVKSITKNGILLYPSFHIYYQLAKPFGSDFDINDSSILEIGNYLRKKHKSGEAKDFISDLIGKDIMHYWSRQISQLTLTELLSTNGEYNLSTIVKSMTQQLSGVLPTNSGDLSRKTVISKWKIPILRISLDNLWIQPEHQSEINNNG